MSVFTKEALIDGKLARLDCLEIGGQTYSLLPRLVRVIHLEDEWYDDVQDPESVVVTLKQSPVNADIFTFWQRLPQTHPRFNYHTEWERIAVLPVTSFDYWWNKQIKAVTRNLVRKAEKRESRCALPAMTTILSVA